MTPHAWPSMLGMKRHVVTLTEQKRAALGQRVSSGRGSARDLTHARILRKADRGPHGPAWTDDAITTALDVSVSTIARVRKRFVEQGVAAAVLARIRSTASGDAGVRSIVRG